LKILGEVQEVCKTGLCASPTINSIFRTTICTCHVISKGKVFLALNKLPRYEDVPCA